MLLCSVGTHVIECPRLHPLAAHKLPPAMPQGTIADVAEKEGLVEGGLGHVEGRNETLTRRPRSVFPCGQIRSTPSGKIQKRDRNINRMPKSLPQGALRLDPLRPVNNQGCRDAALVNP